MSQTSRRHHFSPKFFLGGFTEEGHVKGRLWEFDGQSSTRTKARPKEVAWDRDFYSVDIPGQPPDIVEALFGKIETAASPVLKSIFETEELPAGIQFGRLTTFMALMYARGPRWRQIIISMMEQTRTQEIKITASSRHLWDWYIRKVEKEGKPGPDLTYEQFSEYILSDDFELEIRNKSHAHAEVVVYSLTFLPQQFQRMNWGLLISRDPDAFFVASDSAATVVWDDPGMYQISDAHIGFTGTETVFPLHKRFALVGRHEPVDARTDADLTKVAEINARSAWFTARFLYSPKNDFFYSGPADVMLTSADWFDHRHAMQSGDRG